jgi:2-dehydro-3-deoxyphosphogluconate aldolase/(4S)-4-hydroxy-2-oxoglutarate aldolase
MEVIMAQFDRLVVYEAMLSSGLIPLFHHDDGAIATEVVAACADGGARVFEFTNRGENALAVFAELMGAVEPSDDAIILGAGSIVDAPTAAIFLAAGANFIVGPTFNPDIARLCNRRKVAYIPGCGTVNEISAAEEMGAEIVKLFPGHVGGPAFIEAVRGPMPWTKIMPTGGVDITEESVRRWIGAGAVCLGIGGKLISKDLVHARNFPAVTQRVQATLKLIEAARG